MKNLLLLLRSLANIAAFGLLGYGLATGALPYTILGGVACLACLYLNLIRPLTGRKRR